MVGALSFSLYVLCLRRLLAGDRGYHLPAVGLLAASTWLVGLAALGLFARHYHRPHRVGRYLADASYWCYLAHFPFVVWIPLCLRNLPVPAVGKFAIVFSLTTAACLLTYHFLVRRPRWGRL